MSPSMKNASTNINPSWDGIKINKSILVEKEKL
jgi:hypothetical protein